MYTYIYIYIYTHVYISIYIYIYSFGLADSWPGRGVAPFARGPRGSIVVVVVDVTINFINHLFINHISPLMGGPLCENNIWVFYIIHVVKTTQYYS